MCKKVLKVSVVQHVCVWWEESVVAAPEEKGGCVCGRGGHECGREVELRTCRYFNDKRSNLNAKCYPISVVTSSSHLPFA